MLTNASTCDIMYIAVDETDYNKGSDKLDCILLTDIIDERGFTKNEIAEQLGLSRQGLYNKLNGEKEFKASEIRKLSRLLNLSDSDKNQIFFNDYVDESANQSDTEPS